MAAIDRRTRPERLLVGGVALGAVLAVLTTRSGGVLVAAMPFILAALTGMAKTTTA
jgi:hypothetical protein